MVATMIFVFGVNIGVGPIPFVLNGEMFTEEAKGISGTRFKMFSSRMSWWKSNYASPLPPPYMVESTDDREFESTHWSCTPYEKIKVACKTCLHLWRAERNRRSEGQGTFFLEKASWIILSFIVCRGMLAERLPCDEIHRGHCQHNRQLGGIPRVRLHQLLLSGVRVVLCARDEGKDTRANEGLFQTALIRLYLCSKFSAWN